MALSDPLLEVVDHPGLDAGGGIAGELQHIGDVRLVLGLQRRHLRVGLDPQDGEPACDERHGDYALVIETRWNNNDWNNWSNNWHHHHRHHHHH